MRRAGGALSEHSPRALWSSALALIIGCWCSMIAAGADAPQRLIQAHIVVDAGTAPPSDSAAWQAQALPDNWNLSRPGVGGEAWYRITFELTPAQLVLSTLYIPRLSMSGEAYVNGERLGGATRWGEPLLRQWYVPQLYSVPARLLNPGTNVIHVRLYAYPNNKGGLSEVMFGPAHTTGALWQQRYFWSVTSVQITSAITLGLGALALLAWTLRRWNTAYGYFGVGAVLWALRNLHFFVGEIPVSVVVWEVLVAASLVWVLMLVCMFVIRFAELRLPRVERLFVAYGLAVPFLIAAAGTLHLMLAIGIAYLSMLFIGAYIIKVLIDLLRRERSVDVALLLIASLIMYGLGFHDWITQRDILNFSEPYKLHFAAQMMFVTVAWNMFRRFTLAQARADELTRTLEARVQQKSDELTQSYAQTRQAEAARTLALERERIMRDMHDGVGSQLITAHQLAQRGALKPEELTLLLRDCIDDLRLVIDSLEPVDGDLLTLLANLRYRITDRLAHQGITLKRQVADVPPMRHLSPHGTLQVLRIVQEALTNVVKHAHASEVLFSVALSPDAQELYLTVRDNGRGMPATPTPAGGRGLANMRQRAHAMDGRLAVESDSGGTVVRLALPLATPGSRPGT